MKNLLDWLRRQPSGPGAFAEFRERALALMAQEPGQAAVLRLLAELSGRFADDYFGDPLPASVAETAKRQLVGFLERAVATGSSEPGEQLALLNEIGFSDLGEVRPARHGRSRIMPPDVA